VLSRIKFNAAPLIGDICLKGYHLGIISRQGLAFQGILDAPVEHFKERHHLPDLLLEFRVGFGVGIAGIGMALVA